MLVSSAICHHVLADVARRHSAHIGWIWGRFPGLARRGVPGVGPPGQHGGLSLIEWSSANLLAVDAADLEHAQLVADFLAQRQSAQHLVYETGRS